jgi:hypothetical protein
LGCAAAGPPPAVINVVQANKVPSAEDKLQKKSDHLADLEEAVRLRCWPFMGFGVAGTDRWPKPPEEVGVAGGGGGGENVVGAYERYGEPCVWSGIGERHRSSGTIALGEANRSQDSFSKEKTPWDFPSGVSDAELLRQHRQSRVGRPQFQVSDEGGRQQVGVKPANPAPM